MTVPRWRLFGTLMTVWVTIGATLCLTAFMGCGGGKSAPPESAAAPATEPAPAAPSTAAAPATTPSAPPIAAAPAESTDTRWIRGIPYDVFYDRPLEVAANQTALTTQATAPPSSAAPVQMSGSSATAPVESPAIASVTPAPMPDATMPSAAAPATQPAGATTGGANGAVSWETVAPLDQVGEEINAIRNDLQQKLNTLATYNASWDQIGVDATILATLAGIVEQHPDEVSWKPNAKIARDLAAAMNSEASKTGRSAYTATKTPFDNIVDLLNGNPPPGVTAEDNVPFGDYADRSVLMSRMESNLNGLKSNITNLDRLNEDPATIKRQLTILASLATVIQTDGYDYTQEPEYQAFAKAFVEAALSARDSVDGKDFTSFQSGIAVMNKTCADCHAKYYFE